MGGARTAGGSSAGSSSGSRTKNELWNLLTEYLTPLVDCGVTLPSGACNRIHARNKRVELIVERREYLQDSICTDEDCETTSEQVFYKNPKKRRPLFEGGNYGGHPDPIIVPKIQKAFFQLVDEFASTVKPGKEENTENLPVLYETCCTSHCEDLIYLLEFGKIKDLDGFTKEKYDEAMGCYDGSQAVGHHMSFFMHYIIQFFLGTKLLLYNNVEKAPTLHWMYDHACGGQTFLPYQRKNLRLWMKDLDVTTQMCKAAFRCIYLYVYFRRKFEPGYKMEADRALTFVSADADRFYLRCFKSVF